MIMQKINLVSGQDIGMSAYKDTDGMNYEETPVFDVDNNGFPSKKINVDALSNDIQTFWKMHEKKLWIILVGCSIYLIGAII
jgi:hypothetical protein